MRPLRLMLDGFGCYRDRAEADFSDVEFFALVGPTGAGKSTVIDGLCFALYGTVPRWGRENVIAQALAPAANACRVCVVFEAAGKRYGIVRALTRDARGQVHTKRATLERLDPAIPPDAPLADMLAASIESLADGPEEVKAQVQEILGLTYDHFIQSVLLPQGRFADFLQAEPRKRQDLLVELLAFGVYEKVGQQARRRADLAADRRQLAEGALAGLADATQEAEDRATARVSELAELAGQVDERLAALRQLTEQADAAVGRAMQARDATALLAAVRLPDEVPGLARRIAEADRLVAERREQRDAAEVAEADAKQARDGLGDKTRTELLRRAHEEQRELAAQLGRQQQEHAARQAEQRAAEGVQQAAEAALQRARDGLARAERSNQAAAMAADLRVGEQCPVCRQPVTAVPHHEVPPGLVEATAAVEMADERLRRARGTRDGAASATASAASAVAGTQERLGRLAATLAGAPAEADVATTLAAIGEADVTLSRAQQEAKARRADLTAAERQRRALAEDERRAWAELRRSRDRVVGLGAPEMGNADLAADWETLATWAGRELDERRGRQPDLDAAASSLRQQVADLGTALAGLLGEHDIDGVTDPAAARAEVATHTERARIQLASVRANREQAATLERQIAAHREDEQVASMLGQLLRANTFERWLCGEALDSLMAEASQTLLELSGQQYELDRDERNDLFVIDYQDAAARRPVHTLSGGETFQASLALALALSRQVIELSGGMRDLNSMFLDEGFGTLDEDTLATVGTTLERLAADSDRMIGIITHVQALADRVPVRFVVSRTGASSTLAKERAG